MGEEQAGYEGVSHEDEDDPDFDPQDALHAWKLWCKRRLFVVVVLLVVLWVITIVDMLLGRTLFKMFGVTPRSIPGLIGLVTSPYVHHDIGHIAANSLPILLLGSVILLPEFRTEGSRSSHAHALKVFAVIVVWCSVISGLLTWTLGRSDSVHGGFSSVLFGFLGYLLVLGAVERHWKTILVAVLVGLMYGGMLWGVFPRDEKTSWEGHMFGFLAGALAALAHGYLPFIRLWCQGYLANEEAAAESITRAQQTAKAVEEGIRDKISGHVREQVDAEREGLLARHGFGGGAQPAAVNAPSGYGGGADQGESVLEV